MNASASFVRSISAEPGRTATVRLSLVGIGMAAGMFALAPCSAFAVDRVIQPGGVSPAEVAQTDVGLSFGSLVVAPIPFSSAELGNGLTLGAGYLFNLPGSKTSGVGLGYMHTDNGSTASGLGGSVNFGGGRWTVSAIAAEADVFYELPVGPIDLPINQSGDLYALRAGYGVTEAFTVGLGLTYLDSLIVLDSPIFDGLPEFLQPDLEISLVRLTFDLGYDTRDDTFYPTNGILGKLALTYAEEVDSAFNDRLQLDDRTYGKMVATGSIYRRVRESGVLAASATICGSSNGAPFFDGCGVGLADGLRGFGALANLESWSASLQAEYRGRFSERFGYVAFAGVGIGGDGLLDMSLNSGGSAVGVGLRYRLTKKFGLDYAMDYALNDKNEGTLYLSLGQKF